MSKLGLKSFLIVTVHRYTTPQINTYTVTSYRFRANQSALDITPQINTYTHTVTSYRFRANQSALDIKLGSKRCQISVFDLTRLGIESPTFCIRSECSTYN